MEGKNSPLQGEQTQLVVSGGLDQFYRLLDTLPVAAYTCNQAGLITYYNRPAVELWGREPFKDDAADRFCGSFKLFSADDGSPINHEDCWMARTLQTGKTHNRQRIIIERPDGVRLVVLAHANPIHDESGSQVGAVNVLVDVSEQTEVAEVQARLAAIVESSEDAIVSKTLDGIIRSWNQGAERLFGHTAEEAIGKPIQLIVPEDRMDEERMILERLRRGERVDHIETVRVDKFGHRLDISATISPIRDVTGRIIGASKVARDITARKQAEADIVGLKDELATQLSDLRRLNEMNSRLSSTTDLQTILEGILQTAVAIEATDRGMLSLWDSEAGHLKLGSSLGFTPDQLDVVATGFPEGGASGTCFREKTRIIVEDVESDPRFEIYRDICRKLEIRAVHSIPLMTRAGEVIGVMSVYFRTPRIPSDRERHVIDLCVRQAVDFIENGRLIEQLRDADRRKDEFIATLAHELRNPLAPISNALQILNLTGKTPAIEGVRSIMDRQLKHLVRLVDDLLEVSRITRGKIELRKELVPISSIVDSAVETSRPLMADAGHQLHVSLPLEPLIINADPVRIAQVISNLLNNAAKYTEEGGQVWLSVRRDGSRALVSVKDNGLGISPEMLPRVFDMFLQVDQSRKRSHGGLGIGLTLAKRLIQMHDATIEANSAGLGRGSEFIIRLPLVTDVDATAISADSRNEQESPLPEKKVLVVDDTRAAAHVLSKLLQAMGQRVSTANDAESAIEAMRSQKPDIVFSDIAMPDVDGYELARRVRRDESLNSITLVALTGYGQDSDRQQTKAAGFDYHLVKPVSLEALQELLRSLPSGSEATSC